jgi:hypothetical protein
MQPPPPDVTMPRHAAAMDGRVIPPPPPLLLDARAHPSPSLLPPQHPPTPLDADLLPPGALTPYPRACGLLDEMPRGNVVSFNLLLIDANVRPSPTPLWRPSSARAAPPASRPPDGSRTRRCAGLLQCAGVKADQNVCRAPEGGQGSARTGLPGGARRQRIHLQDSISLVSMYARCVNMGEVRGVFDAPRSGTNPRETRWCARGSAQGVFCDLPA